MKAFVVGGVHSSCGKTTITLGLIYTLGYLGYRVQPFKVGPDYIDPGFHKMASKRASINLDSWMLEKEYIKSTFKKHAKDCDVAIVEGVMGLFDGYDGKSYVGSSADIAKILDIPVILVVDASKMAKSVAPLVYGFCNFDKELKVKGVIFNKVSSKRHFEMLKDAVTSSCDISVLGYLPKDPEIFLKERHLGLVTADEIGTNENLLNRLKDIFISNIDIDLLLKIAKPLDLKETEDKIDVWPKDEKSGIRIALARDKVFSFYYQDNLEMLSDFGAELLEFSPLEDKELPQNVCGIYIGGGYPEIYAKELSKNCEMKACIKKASDLGMPIYAECGGFMYLLEKLFDEDGKEYKMVGVFPGYSSMREKKLKLGYVSLEVLDSGFWIRRGERAKGHIFHYCIESIPESVKRVYKVVYQDIIFSEGYLVNRTLGSFVHIHFGSNPNFAKSFVLACKEFKKSCREK